MDELEPKKLDPKKVSDPLQTRVQTRILILKSMGSAFAFVAVWQISLMMGCKVWLGGALFAAAMPFLYGAQSTKASKARVLVSALVVVMLGIGLIYLARLI